MAAKIDMVGFVLLLAQVRDAGAAAGCDYPSVPAEQAWDAWLMERSEQWHAMVTDAIVDALRDAFIVAWRYEFARRYPSTARMVS